MDLYIYFLRVESVQISALYQCDKTKAKRLMVPKNWKA